LSKSGARIRLVETLWKLSPNSNTELPYDTSGCHMIGESGGVSQPQFQSHSVVDQILQSACKDSLVGWLNSLTILIISLNLTYAISTPRGCYDYCSTHSALLASPTASYSQLSLVVTTTPSCRSRASAIGTSSLLQLLTPSAMTYTLCP
jgi:hypothetical protein